MKEKVLDALDKLNIKLEQTNETDCSFNYNGHTLSCVYGNDNERILRIIVSEICVYGNLDTTQIFPILNEINSRWRYIKAYSLGESLCLSYERELSPNDKDLTPVISLMIKDLDDAIPQVQMFIANIMKKLSAPDGIADTRVLVEDRAPVSIDNARIINGFGYVDLGLSVKWATCNVGASKPSGYGNYYAWGETSPKDYYEESSRPYGLSNEKDGDITFRDVANLRWGEVWRLPTEKEMQELIEQCRWDWSKQDGHSGYKVTSKKNGRYIFLPAAGLRIGFALKFAGEIGYYWTSTPIGRKAEAYCLYLDLESSDTFREDCGYGVSVRPVSECLSDEG